MNSPRRTLPKRRSSRFEAPPEIVLPDAPDRYTIFGTRPGRLFSVRAKRASSYEYYVSLALEYYHLNYIFQVNYWGGRQLAGGLILDFLVFTAPLPTPVWVDGQYWHRGEITTRDRMQEAQLMAILAGQINLPVRFVGEECSMPDAARVSVGRRLI